jgi:hypothetical protein
VPLETWLACMLCAQELTCKACVWRLHARRYA